LRSARRNLLSQATTPLVPSARWSVSCATLDPAGGDLDLAQRRKAMLTLRTAPPSHMVDVPLLA
jgi:hypothetical protein